MMRTGLVMLGLVACGAPPPLEAPLPSATTDPGTGLVWYEDGAGRHRTLWVSLEDGRAIASQPIDGPLWASGPQLWQWIEEPVEVPLYDCGSPEEPVGSAALRRVVLRELTRSSTVELRPLPPIEPARGALHRIRAIASAGPYLFVVEELSIDTCGAHGSTEARAIVWDLRAGQSARVLTPRERWAIAGAEERTARTLLLEESAGTEPSDDVELAALWPSWDPRRGLVLEYMFVMEACHACSDGEWGSYARATRVPAAELPERLARHARVPDWALAAMENSDGGALLGFSTVAHPAPARILDALRR